MASDVSREHIKKATKHIKSNNPELATAEALLAIHQQLEELTSALKQLASPTSVHYTPVLPNTLPSPRWENPLGPIPGTVYCNGTLSNTLPEEAIIHD